MANIVLANDDVVVVQTNRVAVMSPDVQERYKRNDATLYQDPKFIEGISELYLAILDAKSGAQLAIVPGNAGMPWRDGGVAIGYMDGDRNCVKVIVASSGQPRGNPACTDPQPRPAGPLEGHASFSLFSSPSRSVGVMLGNDGSAFSFDGFSLKQLVKSSGKFTGYTAPFAYFSRKSSKVYVQSAGRVSELDLKSGTKKELFKAPTGSYGIELVASETRVLITGPSSLDIYDLGNRKRVGRWFFFGGGEWVLVGEDGAFAASEKGAQYLAIRVNGEVQALDQYADQLYRPDLVFARITGKGEGELESVSLAALAKKGMPPVVEWKGPLSGKLAQRDITVKALVSPRDGGLGRVEWRLNGTVVGTAEAGRGLTLTGETAAVEKLLTLSPGANRIEVVAYTSDGTVASRSVGADYRVADATSEPPRLFVLAVGVNEYRDKALRLKYAAPDARALVDSLKAAAGNVFKSVQVTTITDAEATGNGIKAAMSTLSKSVRSNDVFIFYLAGHGITLDGRYHFLPVDFRYRNEDSIRQNGVTQENLRDWLAEIPALKSLVLLDTCNSGSFVEAQMATRGLAEKTAIDKLTRATGRATISASSDTQVAIEGHQGHGVFTWVLIEGLRAADRNGDKVLSTSELASFVDEKVPELTYKRWGYEQVPQVMLHGREFPVGVVR